MSVILLVVFAGFATLVLLVKEGAGADLFMWLGRGLVLAALAFALVLLYQDLQFATALTEIEERRREEEAHNDEK